MFYREDQNEFINKVKQPDCKLTEILKDTRLNYAVRFEVPEIINYLFDHLSELIDISISESELSMASRGILFDLADQFPLNMSESTIFHNKMNTILSNDPISRISIVVLSRVILSIGKSENYNIMSNLSENQFFFPKFCQLIGNDSVYETLMALASNDHQSISAFFEDLNASAVLFNLIEKSPPSSQDKLFLIISEIILHTDTESTLIASLADNEHASKTFDYATKDVNSNVRFGAFSLLIALCGKKNQANDSYSSNDNEDEGIIFNNATMEFMLDHFDNLCEYISKLTTFDASSSKAVELLLILIKSKKAAKTSPKTFESVNGLLDQFFSNPIQTKLHASCLVFLYAICDTPVSVKNINLKNRILNAWLITKHDNKSSFWGYIFKFAEIVLDLGDDDSNDDNNEETDWDHFIQDYTIYKQVINNSYGGDLPVDSFDNFDEIEGEVRIDDELRENEDFIDDELQVVCVDDNDDDNVGSDLCQADLNQMELDLKNDEDLDHFIISKPKNDPRSPWAKEILDDLNDDFFIPKKERTANDVNWANQILQELQADDLNGSSDNNNDNDNENNSNNNNSDNVNDNKIEDNENNSNNNENNSNLSDEVNDSNNANDKNTDENSIN